MTQRAVRSLNRTIKDATVRRYHYGSHEQLRTRLTDFTAAYDHAHMLKALSGLAPFEFITKQWGRTARASGSHHADKGVMRCGWTRDRAPSMMGG